jgi:hypothetical protein
LLIIKHRRYLFIWNLDWCMCLWTWMIDEIFHFCLEYFFYVCTFSFLNLVIHTSNQFSYLLLIISPPLSSEQYEYFSLPSFHGLFPPILNNFLHGFHPSSCEALNWFLFQLQSFCHFSTFLANSKNLLL